MIITKKTPKEKILGLSETYCGDCGHCCLYGSAIVLPEEITTLSRYLGISEEELKERYLDEKKRYGKTVHKTKEIRAKGKPYGKCIFFHEKRKCTIHESRPQYCRIGTCKPHGRETLQWFYLNYLVDQNDPESIREWADFARFNQVIPGGALLELVPDEKKLVKILNFRIFRKNDDQEVTK